MDFHQLRVFVEVVRQKSFSRAAESIFLSQPTVSAHIKALENEIGAPLLDRSQREIALTEAGKILFRYAQQLLGFKEEALSTIRKKYRIIKGHLEIAASSVPGTYLLPDVLFSFSRKYPEVTFSVLIRDTKKVAESIKDYTYDLGLVGETGVHEDLAQRRLVKDELILIAPPGTGLPLVQPRQREPQEETVQEQELPLTDLKACAHMSFILREPGSATRLVFEKALKKIGGDQARLRIIAFIEGQEAIKEAVKTGLGLTVISRRAVQKELQAEVLEGYRLQDLNLERSFYLIFRKNRILSPLSKAFLEFTVNYFSK
ncbi:MAG: selenium metabolism-associated LysR family transcriptional regulator [Bacillota bacterium]